VRGYDYHVDWIDADGVRSSSPRLPFDWRRLTDTDKQRLSDSVRAEVEKTLPPPSAVRPPASVAGAGDGPPLPAPVLVFEMQPLSEMPDYYPSIRPGAVKADLDGNLWILPTTSAQSKAGELVYDVVRREEGLVQRVRLPVGRSIVGFGSHGIVYLMARSLDNGWSLERARLMNAQPINR
jgi:hypothetical protein